MRWQKADLCEAVRWMANKTIADDDDNAWRRALPEGLDRGDDGFSSIRFDDGCVCVAESICRGPYSEVTPDLDFEPPVFWLGDPGEPFILANVQGVFKRDQNDPKIIYGGIVKSEDRRHLTVQVYVGSSNVPSKSFDLPPGSEVNWDFPSGMPFDGRLYYKYLARGES